MSNLVDEITMFWNCLYWWIGLVIAEHVAKK